MGDGYFVVETKMPSLFPAKKWPEGNKAERKTTSNYARPKGHKDTKRV